MQVEFGVPNTSGERLNRETKPGVSRTPIMLGVVNVAYASDSTITACILVALILSAELPRITLPERVPG